MNPNIFTTMVLLIILSVGTVNIAIHAYSIVIGEAYAQDSRSMKSADNSIITNLSNDSGDSLYPQIASYRDNVYVVWQDNSFTDNDRNYDIYLKKSSDGGISFDGNITNLSNNVGLSDDAQMAMSGSSIYVTWTDDTSGNRDIFFAKSVDAGNTFSKPVNLSNNTSDSYNPEIAAARVSGNKAHVYVVWNDYSLNGNGGIMLITSKDSGATFSKPVNLSNNTKNSYPKIATIDGNNIVYVVWNNETLNDKIGGVYLTKSTDNGASFSKAIKLNNDKMFGEPQIAATSSDDNTGNVYVVWDSYDPNIQRSNDIFFAKSTDDATSFTDVVTLTPTSSRNSEAYRDVGITVDGSNVFVTWEDNSLGNYEIFLRNSSDSGSSFGSIENLTNNTEESLCPQIAISENGILYAVWEDGAKEKKEIMLFKTFI